MEHEESPKLVLPRHVNYFSQSLNGLLPWAYTSLDTNRLTLLHFTLQSLKLLGALQPSSDSDDEKQCCSNVDNPYAIHLNKQQIIDWIYHLQCTHTVNDPPHRGGGETTTISGFHGGTFLMGKSLKQRSCEDDNHNTDENNVHDIATLEGESTLSDSTGNHCCDHVHVAMTYVALCSLKTLGDLEFSRVDRQGIIESLKHLQQSDGSFTATSNSFGAEYDLRFVYCACCTSHLLEDWSGINQDLCVDYILKCQSYDGSFGLLPGQEGHGGSTFCAIASLKLMGRLDELTRKDDLLYWCVHRQTSVNNEIDYVGGPGGGMQGRPNKLQDTCYSYWIGGTLQMLLEEEDVDVCSSMTSSMLSSMIDTDALRNYVLSCQTKFGGFSKVFGNGNAPPDLLHSFYSLAFLSLATFDNESDKEVPLGQLNCALGMSQ